ncbi:MAG: cation:proton antiporter [Calditrichaeota bacterium]|nr:cation:proton antiporter [Calditrichota bacterium]MCB9369185.1 cation:proton antiporter [Calditrichota bacterium]
MIDVSTLFFLMAAVIGLGFLGAWLFKLTRVPEVMLLIGAGVALREFFHLDNELVLGVAPYFGAFALIVIMFEGGLHLDFQHLLAHWRKSMALLVFVFLLSFGAITALAYYMFEHPLLNAALLGSALACTSAAIVVPLVRQVRMNKSVQTILELESSLSDAIAVLITVTLLNIFTTGHSEGSIGVLIVASLTGALWIGPLSALIWGYIMSKISDQPLIYLATFAAMLVVYASCEAVHSSGVFGVFLFGLLLSNGPRMLRKFWPGKEGREELRDWMGTNVKGFHAELTFLVRTFFFVFLGLLFDFRAITVKNMLESVAIYCVLVIARWIAVSWIKVGENKEEQDRTTRALFLFMPRGLASAVLATIPLQYGIHVSADFITVTICIVFLTNLAITTGVRWVEKGSLPAPPLAKG